MKTNINPLKAGFTLLLAIYGILCAKDVTDYRFLDRVDLIPHEAGHLLFGYLGEFPMILGGTIGQLLVPVGITIYFIVRQELYSSTVTLFWVGQNLFNISVYVRDAGAMELPLVSIGGGDAIHDWNYLLSKFGLLRWDHMLANLVYGIGLLLIVVSVLLGFYLSFEKQKG